MTERSAGLSWFVQNPVAKPRSSCMVIAILGSVLAAMLVGTVHCAASLNSAGFVSGLTSRTVGSCKQASRSDAVLSLRLRFVVGEGTIE